MTATSKQDRLASASLHLMSAQLSLVAVDGTERVVEALGDLRSELQRPVLRVIAGGKACT